MGLPGWEGIGSNRRQWKSLGWVMGWELALQLEDHSPGVVVEMLVSLEGVPSDFLPGQASATSCLASGMGLPWQGFI